MAIRVLVPLNPVVRVLVPPNPFARTHHYLALLSALRGLGRSNLNRRGLDRPYRRCYQWHDRWVQNGIGAVEAKRVRADGA